MIGETIAHYEITALLGKGGMGEVYRARDTKLGRDVALKILPDDVAQDSERRARFEREARAIAALNHPNVVTIYAVEEAAGRVLLSMEVVEGQTLGEVIPVGGLPLDRLLDLAVPLAEALTAAHARGITHRDLKPANIMVSRDGRVTVLDFGLAKLIEDDGDQREQTVAFDATAEGRVLGTTAYMSPEQAEGKPVDTRSDVFSLGVLLYQMATGEKPFVGDTPISTMTSIMRDEPRPMNEVKPELPTHLGRIIARCLKKDPEHRYESAKGLKFDLENLREDSSSPSVTASMPEKRNGALRIMVAAAAVVLVVVASVFLLRGDGNGTQRPPGNPEALPSSGELVSADPVVVVFPFENRGEAEDLYFADGITDEIATRLVGMDGLSVLSRSSARNYDRAGKTLEQIASDLGVDYVLEGSVRWQRRSDGGSQVRVSPVLVHAPKDVQVWAESYDRDMSEIFAIQTEISSAVATQIGAAISPVGHDPEFSKPQDMEAYHLFLRARQAIDRGQLLLDEWSVARTLLLNALEKDPTYSVAWAYLARVEAGFCHFNWDRSEERLNAARRAAARARELAPGSAEEHLAHGYVLYWGEKRFPEATREFEAALELRPADVETMEALGFVARREGRYEAALEWLERATGASPSDWRLAFNLSETLNILRRYEEALLMAERAIKFDPGAPAGYSQRANVLANSGRPYKALESIGDFPRETETTQSFTAHLAMAMVDTDVAKQAASRMPDYAPEQFNDMSGLLTRAFVDWMTDGAEAARPAFERAVESLRGVVAEKPDEANPASLLALGLAALGEHEEAVAMAEAALDLYPSGQDMWVRDSRNWDLARVLLLCGRTDEAQALIRSLCSSPGSSVSREFLRAAPLYQEHSPIPQFAVVADFGL